MGGSGDLAKDLRHAVLDLAASGVHHGVLPIPRLVPAVHDFRPRRQAQVRDVHRPRRHAAASLVRPSPSIPVAAPPVQHDLAEALRSGPTLTARPSPLTGPGRRPKLDGALVVAIAARATEVPSDA